MVPTTFVWGTEDAFAGAAGARACGDHVRAAYRFVALDGVGHWVPDQAPEVLAAELRLLTAAGRGAATT